jgi:hypothetical protein
MTQESEHYTGTSKVHKSSATSLDPEPVIRYKHNQRFDLPRAIFAMFSAIAEHIARILLASDPRWWPFGECLHDATDSMSHFVPDYRMQA